MNKNTGFLVGVFYFSIAKNLEKSLNRGRIYRIINVVEYIG